MATIFTKIIAGEIPCHKISENDEFFAFLDIRPLAAGHTLVVPKQEIDYLFDIDNEALGRMMAFAKKIAAAQQAAIPCLRIGLMVIGLEVPHAHIHLVPMQRESDMNLSRKRPTFSAEEFASIAAKIRENIT
ncbi:MAG: HIT family protein [Tannerellaceae bacterium]|jgi:histidine triad (HIT) family protein|nr:HIT family protein [Tannerellaceae bacterium]